MIPVRQGCRGRDERATWLENHSLNCRSGSRADTFFDFSFRPWLREWPVLQVLLLRSLGCGSSVAREHTLDAGNKAKDDSCLGSVNSVFVSFNALKVREAGKRAESTKAL